MRYFLCFVFFTLILGVSSAQVEINNSNRVWYSTYVFKKINHRWSVDNYTLLATRSFKHDFWLAQNNIGVNYRVNRLYTISAAYGHSLYKYTGAWWDRHYPNSKPSKINTIGFHSLGLHIKRQSRLGSKLLMTHKVSAVHFIPKFEKYQLRMQYTAKVAYRKMDLALEARPFIQGAVYYYQNGVPATYYDENEEGTLIPTETLAPNGIHRIRVKAGVNFKPIKSVKWLSGTLYYGYNKELNLTGNELNFLRPSSSGKRTFVTYPFNSYAMFGVQLNVILQ